MFADSEDFVYRILRRKPFWDADPPTVKLYGENKQFGVIAFEFDDGDIIKINIYFSDKTKLETIAVEAIKRFPQFARELRQLWAN